MRPFNENLTFFIYYLCELNTSNKINTITDFYGKDFEI